MSGPSKKLVLASYRSLVRASNPKLTGIRARESTLDSVFVDQLRKLYQKPVTDGKTAWRNYLMAADAITMMTSSTKHAEAMFDGGWCLNKVRSNAYCDISNGMMWLLSVYLYNSSASFFRHHHLAHASLHPMYPLLCPSLALHSPNSTRSRTSPATWASTCRLRLVRRISPSLPASTASRATPPRALSECN